MKKLELSTGKKALLTLLSIFLISGLPKSFAEDLISPIIDAITSPTSDQAPADIPVDPSASPTTQSTAAPTNSAGTTNIPALTDSATATPTPIPAHAIADQHMVINTPQYLAVDPRAHSVYLPQLAITNNGDLLICATTNLTLIDIGQSDTPKADGKNTPSQVIAGSNSSNLQISGIRNQASNLFNGSSGARAYSSNRALAGSYINLKFVALSEPSDNPALCNSGSVSNNRTIYLRALDLDLNMIKGDVRLK
jgi:hypothetical protein